MLGMAVAIQEMPMKRYHPAFEGALLLFSLICFIVAVPSSGLATNEPVEITECGQRVAGAAFLARDLDCSDAPVPHGIIFEDSKRGILELRGFSILGPAPGTAAAAAIRCEKNCDIFGQGGSVGSDDGWGIAAVKRVRIYDLTIHDTARRGVDGRRAAALYNTTIVGAREEALTGDRLRLENCTIVNNGLSTLAPVPAVHGHAIRVFNTTIIDNQGVGAEGIRATVRESVVTNNGLHESCGVTYNCNFDIGSMRKPRIRDTICNYSFDASACGGCPGQVPLTETTDPALHNWGLCTLDPTP